MQKLELATNKAKMPILNKNSLKLRLRVKLIKTITCLVLKITYNVKFDYLWVQVINKNGVPGMYVAICSTAVYLRSIELPKEENNTVS